MTSHPREVYRVEWVPGTDHLLGVCFCGAEQLHTDPNALWEWLHDHPRGHDPLPVAVPGGMQEVPA